MSFLSIIIRNCAIHPNTAVTLVNGHCCKFHPTLSSPMRKFGDTDTPADFLSISIRSASAVTPTKKSSINTNRKSTTRFQMNLTWTSYVAPKSPEGWLKNAKCPKFEQEAAITPKQYEMGCQLVLITNRKSHMGAFDWYRPRWPWTP